MFKYLAVLVAICTLGTLRTDCAAGAREATATASSNVSITPSQTSTTSKLDIRIPLQDKSVRFAVIGDSGTGEREQYEVARQMVAYWQATKFDFVIMLGDNIYGGHSPRDFARKFEQPYKELLDAGVKFYASL